MSFNRDQFTKWQTDGATMLQMIDQHSLLEVLTVELSQAESIVDVKAVGTRIVQSGETGRLSAPGAKALRDLALLKHGLLKQRTISVECSTTTLDEWFESLQEPLDMLTNAEKKAIIDRFKDAEKAYGKTKNPSQAGNHNPDARGKP